jgi:hypothetical protein
LQPKPGLALYQIDGRKLGRVEAVNEGAFQATLDSGNQHWIASTALFTIKDDRAMLICDESGLQRYIVPPPTR